MRVCRDILIQMSLNESRLYGRLCVYHKVSVIPSFPSLIFISKDVMADYPRVKLDTDIKVKFDCSLKDPCFK